MSQSFNDMLNDSLSYDLLKEELKKKNYLWARASHDDDVAGDIIVPFQSSRASSVKAGGGPTATTDISKHSYVRGSVAFDNIPKVWGSMIFNYEDILSHDGRVKAKSFLGKFLPDQIDDFTTYFSEVLNHSVLNSANKDTAAGTGTSGGILEVNRIERYEVGEKLIFDPASADKTGYVSAIDMNTNKITVVTARGGSTGVDLTGVASGEKIYKDGFQTSANQMTSLRDALLSSANGGDSTIYGKTKTASRFTQAINIDGSTITKTNILSEIFDGIVTYRKKAKVGMVEIWMSFKHLGSIMKILEQDKGPYKTQPGSLKSNEYGFTEIMIFGPDTGAIKFVGIQGMDDDIVYGMDPKAFKFHSVKGIQKVKTPDGNYYYTVRDETNGYDFVCDLFYRGDFIVSKPHRCAVWYSISY